jgi:ADP-ribosylglycohydrolase
VDWIEATSVAVITGSAVADALGGATEGWTPEQIEDRYGGPVSGIVGPFNQDWRHARPIAPYHKGDGHITDDTLMTRALVDCYAARRAPLDAYAVADELVPRMMGDVMWVPELEGEHLLLQRVFLAEKWLVARLHYGHVDPREAGVGNLVNCGAAMYMAPVGLARMGDPTGAYQEAIDIAGAHQSSYGREAAGVFAAAVAQACVPGTTVAEVMAAARALAHDGTASALAAVAAAVGGVDPPTTAAARRDLGRLLRATVAPFDSVGDMYRQQSLDARRPSRTKSIEELPVALGFVLAHRGDYREAVLGAVNYGRDADSIASMAGAICAGLSGPAAVPSDWLDQVEQASRMDLRATGRLMADVVRDLLAQETARLQRRQRLIAQIGASEGQP